MDAITQALARELGRRENHIQNVIDLIDQGATIPFIARYRKELHGSMDDQLLRQLADRLQYLRSLAARKEELERQLFNRKLEYDAITAAIEALQRANARLQERFSPELNRLSGAYLAQLTGDRYTSVTLNRELEGAATRSEDILPRSVLTLSRGTADQLYLAVRLAVCRLCLPEKPPIVLDDALAAFDDRRMTLALDLLQELAGEQQLLLFTCHSREGSALANSASVTRLEL